MKLIVLKMENQPSVVCDKQITDGFYFYVKAIKFKAIHNLGLATRK